MKSDETERPREEGADALAELAEREALINRITSALRSTLDPAEVFRNAVEEMGVHLAVDRCILFMIDREAGVVRNVAEYDAPGMEGIMRVYALPLVKSLVERVRAEGVVAVDDVTSDERLSEIYEEVLSKNGTRSLMYAAINVGDEMRGAFALSSVRAPRHWRASEIALARAVANQTGIAVRQAELFEMVARAKRMWEATFDAMSDGVFIFGHDRRLARVNRAGAAMESLTPQEMLGRVCCDILRARPSTDGCVVEAALREGRGVTREYTPEGLGRTLLVTAELIRGEAELPPGVVCTVRDLSELRQIEAVARVQQSLLTNILESAREAICALDPSGHLMWCNSATTRMGGYPQEELIGHHFLEWTIEADRPHAAERFALALAGKPQAIELRFVARDGSVRYLEGDNTPLVVDGNVTGVLSISRDVTEIRHERERAAQADKLRALGQLASGVAHDFNNALAAILGRAQLLRRDARDEETAHSLDVIQTAAEDAAATVRRIRAFARQSPEESGARVDLGELVADAIEITRMRWENDARARGVNYDVWLEADCELYAKANASELREVFVNLIFNALDAMPEGGELAIKCTAQDERIRLSFADTGAGMTEEVRGRMFEPFYTTKGSQGTGLGLFVSYGIVQRHGGTIQADSEPGRGTTFVVTLPRARPARAGEERPETAAAERARTLSVLVVDDEEFVRETLVEMVAALGHRVVAADGAHAALRALEAARFDLVFTDLSMPGMDGWGVAREIRRRWPGVGVCIVTGYGKEAERPPGGGERLVDAVIGKPFNFEQVEETLAGFGG
ncbi:MAG TPA: PAS domain S-box protein [Pyrinomonadaceae bacterium]|nr:PAS domain S-box protein [Pyrinomonadaceae bacterium]